MALEVLQPYGSEFVQHWEGEEAGAARAEPCYSRLENGPCWSTEGAPKCCGQDATSTSCYCHALDRFVLGASTPGWLQTLLELHAGHWGWV